MLKFKHPIVKALGCKRALFSSSKFDREIYGYKERTIRNIDVAPEVIKARSENSKVYRLIDAYRSYGHIKAQVNPLQNETSIVPELDPALYGLQVNESHDVNGLVANSMSTLSTTEVVDMLEQVYCGPISAEFMHLPTLAEREWFIDAFESLKKSSSELPVEEKKNIAALLLRSQVLDNFLAVKFQSVKRYGGEGAESIIPYFHETFRRLAQDGVSQVIVGMNHRGRLNILTESLKVPPSILFRKMKGLSEFPSDAITTGDVLSHIGSSVNLEVDKRLLHVTMFPNPSHLEAVNPVVAGKTRARQRTLQEGDYSTDPLSLPGQKVVCIQVHGDAAMSGQGVIQETLAFSAVPHFNIGGTIHLCTNNQVGYTTPGERTRSNMYATDVAKMSSFPVIHVNGDDPEAVAQAARLAVDYQRRFRRDVFVDLLCFRRWGHNELDNPRFTNPKMYSIIDAKTSVPDAYADKLVQGGVMNETEVKQITDDHHAFLSDHFVKADTFTPDKTYLEKQWSKLVEAPDTMEVWDTGVDVDTLRFVGGKSVYFPEDFNLHPHLRKSHVEARLKKVSSGVQIDWATGEALAMGSLLHQGYNVRISGQDVGRGTFSQRHCLAIDQDTELPHVPLNHLHPNQTAHLEVASSILSEEAVMGFEYGFSVESPNTLCIWEAQFGDFYNGAQIMIDTFVSSGEAKWMTQSGLTLLLPHGFDGAGPEHSSCHLERFLQNCDSSDDKPDSERVNWNVVHPTTPAQMFHLLRKQMIRNYRKPLIIAGPKTLLRLSAATSTLDEMKPGTHFLPIIGDPKVSAAAVKKVIFVSGKLYYTLAAERDAKGVKDTAIIRLEQLCPFPTQIVNEELAKYKNAKKFLWVQEEHKNMGAWSFVQPRFQNLCSTQLQYVGRGPSAATATGIGQVHKSEDKMVLEKAFQ